MQPYLVGFCAPRGDGRMFRQVRLLGALGVWKDLWGAVGCDVVRGVVGALGSGSLSEGARLYLRMLVLWVQGR